MAIELATAYVSLVPETNKLEAGVRDAFKNVGKQADLAGKDIGNRIAVTASKALKSGWRPDQDIMSGIPNTKLDRIGARMGQVIGKGVVGGLKARQIGQDFGKSFASGAGSIGLGSVISGWRSDLQGQSNKLGFVAGKALSAGLTAAVGVGVAGVGMALKGGFDRLVALDTAQYKLKQILKASGRDAKDFDKINKAIQNSVDSTPFSLDQAFGTAVQAIGAGASDIERFMGNVADAAGFAGTDLERMGLIFTQVLAKGKLTGEETMQLMEAGLPARSWIQKSYNLTAEQFDSMQEKGEITLDMLQKSIEDHAPGMAKALGNTLQGSIDNMQTALARVGANFLSAIFGGDTGDPTEGLKDTVQRLTDMLKRLDAWIVANKDNIREFFDSAKGAAETLFGVLGSIASTLKEHPGLIEAVVTAFVAWKTITAVGSLATALSGITTSLGLIPGLASSALGPISALLAAGSAAYFLGTEGDSPYPGVPTPTDPTGERGLQNRATGTSIMGVPSMVNDPIFGGGGEWVGGGGEFGGGVPGTAGRGYFNSRAAAQWLDRRTMSDAALLSNVPSGRYEQTQAADLTQGLGDCTSAIEDLVNIIDGRSTSGRSMATGNAAEWLTARGFRPGTRPGAFNVGFNSGHMQATLPGGTPFNWGSNASAANRGIGGSGAFDPALTQRYYRYDTGGWLPPGTTTVQNDTGKPELILNPEQQKQLADLGADPAALIHGATGGAPPGPPPAQGEQGADYGMDFFRSLGFIPANAGNTGVAGTSSLASIIGMGNDVVGGLIDTGTSLAQTAVSAAITAGVTAGTFGGGAAAAPFANAAASYGIQLLGNQAKRLSSYGFQMAGIGADALVEQLFPFGAPRWLGYDYTQFAPQLNIMGAATSTLEQMGSDAIGRAFAPQGQPGAAPQSPPGMLPGMPPPPPPATPSDPVDLNASGPAVTNPGPDILQNLMGYDQGGMLPPGGLGINMTSRPEPVLTPQQWDAIAASSSSPTQGAPLVQNLYAQDMQDAIRQLEKVKRRDMLQYAGRP